MPDPSRAIAAFELLINTQIREFVESSKSFGEPISAMALMVKNAFEEELNFMYIGMAAPRPDNATLQDMLRPLSEAIQQIQSFRDRNRAVEQYFDHLSTISESILALSWVSVTPAPAPFIRDMRDAGEYFGNRVLSRNKGNASHANWINKWNEVLAELEQYVRQFHLTGFAWGASAGRTAELSAAPSNLGNVPPPPPLPPTGGGVQRIDMASGGDAIDRNALFKEINLGGDNIAQILRPVRRAGQAPAVPPAAGAQLLGARAREAPRTFPPKCILEGRKWRIEHQRDNFELSVNNSDISQSVAIFRCENSGIQIQNKVNNVTIDNCKRTTVVVGDVISSVEAIRCDRLKIQCSGHVPLINLDSSDSVQIFVTAASRDVEVISSKCTSSNICLLDDDGDYAELPVPEQIRTVIVDNALQSTVIEKV